MDDILIGIGQELKEAREGRGFSIAQAADRLRVRERYLLAAEDGNFSDIPNRGTYITGFLRAYANLCELDSESIIARYKEAVGDEEGHDYQFPQVTRRRFWPRVAMAASVLLIAGVGFYFYQHRGDVEGLISNTADGIADRFGSGSVATLEEEITETVEDIKENTPIPEPIKEAASQQTPKEPKASITKPVERVEKVIEKAKEEVAKAPLIESEAAEAPSEPAQPEKEVVTTEETDDKKNIAEKAVAESTTKTPEKTVAKKIAVLESSPENRIVLLAKEDTWVKVVDDQNNFIVERVMKVGDTYFLPEKQNLKITTGNAESIEVFIEGEEHSFLGTLSDLQRR